MRPIGLYIHVPFCRSKCGYCDFYSLETEDLQQAYLKKVLEEISSYDGKSLTADTLFIGGGTPSLLKEKEVEALLSACRKVFSLKGEITMEVNPDSVSPDYLKALHSFGVNRISIGAQSVVERELQALGRRHHAKQIADAALWAKAAGFQNLSLDIMLGIPHQTLDSLRYTLDFIMELKPQHLSCYLLKIEKGTPFSRRHVESLCANEDQTADFYLQTVKTLLQNGYQQYEISNFCYKGYESRHNLKYWHCEEYLGFGPAAHSFYDKKRSYHPPSLENYLQSPDFALVADGEGGSAEEQIFLRLRLAEGVQLSDLPDRELAASLTARSARYQRGDFMTLTDGRLAFTPKGFLVSNSILAELLF